MTYKVMCNIKLVSIKLFLNMKPHTKIEHFDNFTISNLQIQ